MSITLNQILNLVGKLDDSLGEETPRERFRSFLKENVREVGQVRDYIEECLRTPGPQHNRALQDLVNYVGRFLGFEVTFGRYHGVQGQIGFDGHWKSPTGFHLVVEAKTTEAYAIKTTTLVGYVDELISEKKIPNWDKALGVYVVGRPDKEIRQLENAILAEKRTHQLRTVSVHSLLTLADLMNRYDVRHDDVLNLIRPSAPSADPMVDLLERLSSQPVEEKAPIKEGEKEVEEGEIAYWLSPVKSDADETAEEVIQTLVDQEKIYAFGERTFGRKHLKPGDWICFYASGKGVVAHAKVTSSPRHDPNPKVRQSEKYPWVFSLGETALYLDEPVIIDADIRGSLNAFEGQDTNKAWGWFVIGTRKITKHDFEILARTVN